MPPYGVDGGEPGAAHNYRIIRNGVESPIGTRDTGVRIAPGDRIVCKAAGGGGYGDPRARERELIRRDLEYGYISPEAARTNYRFDE